MADVRVLNGPRLSLRAPRIEDANVLFERIASDPEVTRYLAWPTHPDVAETRRVITELFNVGTEHTWLLELEDEAVGLCGWRPTSGHSVDIGYCLGRRWWGQGLMSEAVGLLLDDVRSDASVYRVSAYCHVDNTASARVLERSGLALEARLVRYGMFPNLSPEPQECLLFGKALR